jgi:hypothetical protein
MPTMNSASRVLTALVAVAAVLSLAACGSKSANDDSSSTGSSSKAAVQLGPAFGYTDMTKLPGALNTPPPWPANVGQLQLRLRAIGLSPLGQEGTVVHIHQHLDIYVDGKQYLVPGDLGIGAGGTFFSDLHTHSTYPPGIIHVESATPSSFSLGQFFAVWGVPLSDKCIGSLCAKGSKTLRAWVNGKPVNADPTRIVLVPHQEIVIAFGTPAEVPSPVPSTYAFPEGV